ncbi:DEAD/DEAH box helicase family protein [Nocardia sp. alder85J]|uniref:DEAD/DEAH box helicase family protein n=1 Tax=Nocardia sp. alder85J TaxID=2862949 RepID=UPI001CD4FAE0|nr:DEAD/DEAH box helicase family protein [Nocardia sp. alder85J]MCX4093604.1 DEAD/DEAH box helicase family protein [Nocardia sp. alder85J]
MAKQVGALGPTGTRVAERLRELRAERGLTLQALATRLAELGRPVDMSALAKVEKGQRRIDVDDLIALALALDASPNWLLLPRSLPRDTLVALTPAYQTDGSEVWSWAIRDRPAELGTMGQDLDVVERSDSGGSNFEFLRHDWPDLYAEAIHAERLARTDPSASCMHARRALEIAVAWVYQVDGSLTPPDRPSLGTMTAEPALTSILGPEITQKMHSIRRQVNSAVHTRGQMNEDDAVCTVSDLFDVVLGIVRIYSPDSSNLTHSNVSFNHKLIPVQSKSLIRVSELRTYLESPGEHAPTKIGGASEISDREYRNNSGASTDSAVLRNPPGRARENIELGHGYQIDTLETIVDVLLEEAGWIANSSATRNYRLARPSSSAAQSGQTVDYVLWDDDNGKPLALVETKIAGHDLSSAEHQARIYADQLEAEFDQRPVAFYTDGNQTYILDGIESEPRRVEGFYTNDQLRRLIKRRSSHIKLTDIQISDSFSLRHYQGRAIRSVLDSFVANGDRRALLAMAQGSGKTLTAVALVDALVRANRIHRTLFLTDRVLTMEQTASVFKEHIPGIPVICGFPEGHVDARIYVSTYQTMLAIMNRTDEFGLRKFGPGYFDLIIIGEASSGYRQYRTIVDYFDSLVVAFTSAPVDALDDSVYQFYGSPTDVYDFREAVEAGFAIPPTFFAMTTVSPHSGIEDTGFPEDPDPEDSLDCNTRRASAHDLKQTLFNTDVIDAMLDNLMHDGLRTADGSLLGKSVIFAKDRNHAELIAERFKIKYTQFDNGFAQPITSRNLDFRRIISRFASRDEDPRIAISAGILEAGIDIPSIVNVVFFRPVRTRSLFWQMLGIGARTAPDLFGPNRPKTRFHVFDYCRNFEFARM